MLGDVAGADVGTAPGNAPVLGPDGRLPASLTPDVPADLVAGGEFSASQVPGLPASRFIGEVSADRFRLPVTKLVGEVPLPRIPASKRPSSRVGVSEVKAKQTYRLVRDSTAAAKWGMRPDVSDISAAPEGGVLVGTMEVTRYVSVSESALGVLARGLGVVSGQTTGTITVGGVPVDVTLEGDTITFGAVEGEVLQRGMNEVSFRAVRAVEGGGGGDGGGEGGGGAGRGGGGYFGGDDATGGVRV